MSRHIEPSRRPTPKPAAAPRTAANHDPVPRPRAKRLTKREKAEAAKAARKLERLRQRRALIEQERTVRVRELDPAVKCGPRTSVRQMYRVDETVEGRLTVHLVFLDHHGWYCFHGPDCRAVRDARRFGRD